MSLPKIDVPTYDLTLPTTGETLSLRPFNVREEKLLLIALESKDQNEIQNTVKQVVNNCIVAGKFDVNKAAFFEVDFIFIFLRAKSIGDKVAVKLTCNNVLDSGEKCANIFPAELDISNCELVDDNHIDNDIKLGDGKGVRMKYPGYSAMKRIDGGTDIDRAINIVIGSIDYIYDKDGIYSSKDHTKEELQEFVEGLTEANFRKMEDFTQNFPSFAVRINATCNKCGFEHSVRYTDFADFFL
jgi:hypothetical protein